MKTIVRKLLSAAHIRNAAFGLAAALMTVSAFGGTVAVLNGGPSGAAAQVA